MPLKERLSDTTAPMLVHKIGNGHSLGSNLKEILPKKKGKVESERLHDSTAPKAVSQNLQDMCVFRFKFKEFDPKN